MEKLKFFSQFANHPVAKESVAGTEYEPTYKQDYDEKGVCELIVSGKTNTYEKIQSFAEDTDIYKIIARFVGGDVSVLDKNKGFYADVTEVPDTLSGWHNKIEEGKNIWNGLPTDFKTLFNNDLNQFVNAVYDDTFKDTYERYQSTKSRWNPKPVESVKAEEVVKGVSKNE